MAGRPKRRARRNPVLGTRRVTGRARARFLPAVWAMLVHSYAAIGVPHRHPGELLADYPVWDLGLDGEKQPRAFTLYKRTPRGLKSAASGSDGAVDGRDTVRDSIQRKFRQRGVYGETSGAVEKIAARAGAPAVCAVYVPEVIGKTVRPMADGVHYRREITGVGEHEKVLLGRPKGVPTTSPDAPACPVPNPRTRRK